MKRLASILILTLAPIGAHAEASGSKAAVSGCAKAKLMSGADCGSLRVEFDLSRCEGEASKLMPARIRDCSTGGAEAVVRTDRAHYSVALVSSSWAGKAEWLLSGAVSESRLTAGTDERASSEATERVPAAGTPAGAAAGGPTVTETRETDSAQKPPIAASPEAVPSFTPMSLAFSGDFRFRHEYVRAPSASATDAASYHQQRLRLRLGAKAQLVESTQVELRLATGKGRQSTLQTLGTTSEQANGAFSSYDFRLDRAAFKVKALPALSLAGGRIGNPFYLVGENDLIWDADLNFDGLHAAFERKLGGTTILANSSFFWLQKTSASGQRDVSQQSFQIGAKQDLPSEAKLGAAASLHSFKNVNGHVGLGSTTSFNGNTNAGTTKAYTNDFNVLELGTEAGFGVAGIPLAVFGSWVKNLAAASLGQGFIAGLKLGSLKKAGNMALTYDYRKLEADSTIGAFTDGDSMGGGSNGRSHRLTAGYQINSSWNLATALILGEARIAPGEGPVARNKAQLDLNFKL